MELWLQFEAKLDPVRNGKVWDNAPSEAGCTLRSQRRASFSENGKYFTTSPIPLQRNGTKAHKNTSFSTIAMLWRFHVPHLDGLQSRARRTPRKRLGRGLWWTRWAPAFKSPLQRLMLGHLSRPLACQFVEALLLAPALQLQVSTGEFYWQNRLFIAPIPSFLCPPRPWLVCRSARSRGWPWLQRTCTRASNAEPMAWCKNPLSLLAWLIFFIIYCLAGPSFVCTLARPVWL